MDWLPSILAALGRPDIKEKLWERRQNEAKAFEVHLDGTQATSESRLRGEGAGATDLSSLAGV